ncbi:hypothetical protein [Catenulispora subtropica]|uniref:Uncharacterized protein n=1 Tax=Catenulispora subtropica TaxID=450798 RepID=A0ABN2SZ11_9ACTN
MVSPSDNDYGSNNDNDNDDDTPPPARTTTVNSPSATTGASYNITVTCKTPPGTGAMHDATDAPTGGKGFAGYTWNQATTAIFGGCADGSYVPPKDGTWADPLNMETAHFAILSIKQMLHNYADDVDAAKKQITDNHWSGPAAKAFGQVIDAFTKYLRDLADIMTYPPADTSLLRIAHMNEAFDAAATFIWQSSSYTSGNDSGAHDRDTPVTITGDLSFDGKMIDAGRKMLEVYDLELKKLYE